MRNSQILLNIIVTSIVILSAFGVKAQNSGCLNDVTPPVITPLSSSIKVTLDASGSKTVMLADIATVTDNCNPNPLYNMSPASFTLADIGFKTITVNATDGTWGTPSPVSFNAPSGIAMDASGNIYVAEWGNKKIRKITSSGMCSTLSEIILDGSFKGFVNPTGIAIDADGNYYVADQGNNRIKKITPSGEVIIYAGGVQGYQDGNGTSARFNHPSGLALDAAGNLYVADTDNQRIRKISPDGAVTTFAGSVAGSNDGTGTAASFSSPFGIASDASGNLYVADQGNNSIRKISAGGVVTTLAGAFNGPSGLTVDNAGNVIIVDAGSNSVKRITAAGDVTVIASNLSSPRGVAIDNAGNLYVADAGSNTIRKITAGGLSSYAGNGTAGLVDGNINSTATGNQSSMIIQVEVVNQPAPVITPMAPNMTTSLDASGTVTNNVTDYATITSSSALTSVTIVPSTFTCTNIGAQTVTITAVNASGATSSLQIPVTVSETISPVIMCPSNVQIQCGSSTSPSVLGTATATDNCTEASAIDISYSDVSTQTATGPGNCNYTISRTWKAKDRSGNYSTVVQKINSCQMSVSLGANMYILYGALGYVGCHTLTPTVTGGIAPYTYSWTSNDPQVGSSTASSVSVCRTSDAAYNYSVTVTSANGCTATASAISMRFINISCSSNNEQKVAVCLRPPGNVNNCHNVCVSVNAVQALLKDGSYLGNCLADCSVPNEARPGFQIAPVEMPVFEVKVVNNPTVNYFTLNISSTRNENISVRVSDVHGRIIEVKENMSQSQVLRLGAHYSSGVYFAEVTQGKDRKVLKLIKQ